MPMTPAHVVIIRHIVKFQLQDIRINLSGIVIAKSIGMSVMLVKIKKMRQIILGTKAL